MMIFPNRHPRFRLTHKPTGLWVRMETRRARPSPEEHEAARRWLLSKLVIPPGDEAKRQVRSYHLGVVPGGGSLAKQGGKVIATGDRVRAMLEGEWLPRACPS